MADGYLLNKELMELVQRVVRQYSSSFQPRPKKGRRPSRVGRGGQAAPSGSNRLARVVVLIPPSSGNLSSEWSDTGKVRYLDEFTGEEITTGGETVGGTAGVFVVGNKKRVQYNVDCMVEVDGRGYVVNGDCFPPPASWWHDPEA